MTNNKALLSWVDEMTTLCQPDKVVWFDGSDAQQEAILQDLMDHDAVIKLNEEKHPNCYLFRSHISDVARVEERTFIASEKEENAGPTNNWYPPAELKEKMKALYSGAMKGRTLYVIPFCMGPIDSPASRIGVQITDSPYVALNMKIMTRTGQKVLDRLGDDGFFVPCLHSVGKPLADGEDDVAWPCAPMENKYIAHFPETREIWSYGSGYGGNALLGKKCLALRIASVMARDEGWMAEHMLILGIEDPQGNVDYITAAFPSACGKTNLAMLIPPEVYAKQGYKVWTVGDDIAWMHIGDDGRLYAINPENGFFGVAPGTNDKSNPNALASTKKGTIFTNVVHNLDDNTVWWEGLDKNPPANAVDWKGNPWNGQTSDVKGAHPNSRFTAPAVNCPCISPEFENPQGVPISAFVFGGRRAKLAPLVYQSRDWNHGVFVGSIMASETTAAAAGAVGVVRRDPMAMLPFCGYNMADYWQHWIDIGATLDADKAPKIFNVNWFRKDDEGNFMWPGFGDNLRVLEWIIKRCEGKVDAVETPIGYVPDPKDINLEGLEGEVTIDSLKSMLDVDKALWNDEAEGIAEFYAKFGDKVPAELQKELANLKENLQ